VIAFDHVGKRYRTIVGREVRALEDLTIELRAGEVFGLAGPNGAGKSTLISLLLGYVGPSGGTISIEGLDPRRYVEAHGISYQSELVSIPPAWRLEETLKRYALLAGVPAARRDERVERVIEWMGLGEHREKRVKQLSKGTLQRLGLAQALLAEERVIVLDEPTHGLDPVWTQRFRDVVLALRRDDRVILIASHNLDELARVADRVAIIDHGRIQRVVDVRGGGVRDGAERTPYRIAVARGLELLPSVFPDARDVGQGEYQLDGLTLDAVNAGLATLLARGALVSMLHPVHSRLEQQFREVVGVGEESA
jgi:ABC-type multidrug transport system ATPase subunit